MEHKQQQVIVKASECIYRVEPTFKVFKDASREVNCKGFIKSDYSKVDYTGCKSIADFEKRLADYVSKEYNIKYEERKGAYYFYATLSNGWTYEYIINHELPEYDYSYLKIIIVED